MTVLFRPDHDVTIGHSLYDSDPARMAAMLHAGIDLDPEMRRYAELAASRA